MCGGASQAGHMTGAQERKTFTQCTHPHMKLIIIFCQQPCIPLALLFQFLLCVELRPLLSCATLRGQRSAPPGLLAVLVQRLEIHEISQLPRTAVLWDSFLWGMSMGEGTKGRGARRRRRRWVQLDESR